MKNTIEQLHIAAQYLAAAGISFLDKKEDDSHTNLGWEPEHLRLITHPFGKNNQMALDFQRFSLEWLTDGKVVASKELQDSVHSENLNWIKDQVSNSKLPSKYNYSFHYELPYRKITKDYNFPVEGMVQIADIWNRLNIAQKAFENFLSSNHLTSPIRVWPHHFDMGIYTKIDKENNLFLGAGLAFPDSLEEHLYYYASGWKDGSRINPKEFNKLENGVWRSEGWLGATLPSSEINETEAELFLFQAMQEFRQTV